MSPIRNKLTTIYVYSVVVKPDKKLLTVLFPDGRDGRTFTLKVCLKLSYSSLLFACDYPYLHLCFFGLTGRNFRRSK